MGNKLQHGHVDADDGGTLGTIIGTGQLKTATGSAVSAVNTALIVTMNDYAFAPSLTNDTETVAVTCIYSADPNNTVACIRAAPSTLGGITTIRWRYITASDDPTIWMAYDPDSGMIKAVWVSDDPTVDERPGVIVEGCISKKFMGADLAVLGIAKSHLSAAERYIAANKMKIEHRFYRALQIATNDSAPFRWLLENVKIDPRTVGLAAKAA